MSAARSTFYIYCTFAKLFAHTPFCFQDNQDQPDTGIQLDVVIAACENKIDECEKQIKDCEAEIIEVEKLLKKEGISSEDLEFLHKNFDHLIKEKEQLRTEKQSYLDLLLIKSQPNGVPTHTHTHPTTTTTTTTTLPLPLTSHRIVHP